MKVNLFLYTRVYVLVLQKDGVLMFAPAFKGVSGAMYGCLGVYGDMGTHPSVLI